MGSTLFRAFALLIVLAATSCKPEQKTLNILTPSIEAEAGGGTFEIKYESDGQTVQPTASAPGAEEWIRNFDVSANGIVAFEILPNESNQTRQGTVRIDCNGAVGKCVVFQSGGGKSEPDYDVEFEASVQCRGIYYGEAYSPGTGNYFITFSDRGTDGNKDNYVQPDGTYYTFDFYADLWEGDPSATGIPEGTYVLDPENSCTKGTFSQKYGQYAKADSDGYLALSMAYTSGTCTITKNGDEYEIDAVVTLEDNTIHHVTYRGAIVCKKNADGPGYEYIEEDIDIENIKISQAVYDHSDDSILLQFTDMTADAGGTVAPPGTLLNIRVRMDVSEEGFLIGGTLTADAACGNNTFLPGEMIQQNGVYRPTGTYAEQWFENLHVAYGMMVDGTVKITGSDGIYDIDIDLITSEEKHVRIKQSSVSIPLYGWNPEDDPITTLPNDYVLDLEGANATASYYGDYYESGYDNWILKLTPTSGNDGFQLEYFGDGLNGPDNGIPTGTFTASTDPGAGKFIMGYKEGYNMFGTWFLGGYDSYGNVSQFAPAKDGTVTVTHNPEDGTYTISLDLYDDDYEPNNFSGSWTGTVTVNDKSASSSRRQSLKGKKLHGIQ